MTLNIQTFISILKIHDLDWNYDVIGKVTNVGSRME